MKLAGFPRALFYMGLVVILGNCAQALVRYRPATPDTSSAIRPVLGDEAAASGGLPASALSDPKEARRVLASHEKRLSPGRSPRHLTLAQMARLCFIIGQMGERQESEKYFEKGRRYAELLCKEQPRNVEGHYWLALNLAGLAEVGRASRGLRLVPVIVEHLQMAVDLGESYDQGGPHRVLGRVYCEAPAWPLSEGDLDKSLQHLRSAVAIAPENSTNHLYLAATLAQMGRSGEAYRELQQVLTCSRHAISARNLEEDHREAQGLIQQYERPAQTPAADDGEGSRIAGERTDGK